MDKSARMRVIFVAGGTGFIGNVLCQALLQKGYSLKVLTRDPSRIPLAWKGKVQAVKGDLCEPSGWSKEVNGCHGVINLSGEPLFSRRWDAEHKQKIYVSRVNGTRNLANAIGESLDKPEVFISASGIGFYGSSEDQEFDERSAAGQDFIANLAKDWEEAAYSVLSRHIRLVNARIGVVLHPSGGALAAMLPAFRFGLGGSLGSGMQWISWIHRHDLIRMLVIALEQKSVSGPINCTAPEPARQKDFAKALALQLKRPCLMRIPSFVLRIFMGEGAEVALSGQKVLPDAIRAAGFKFKYPTIEDALSHLFRGRAF